MFTKFFIIKSLALCKFIFIAVAIIHWSSLANAASNQTDPTKPPSVILQQLATEIKPQTEFKLTAIFKRENKLYAVINGVLFSAGENLDALDSDMRVEKISSNTVLLKSNSEEGKQTELSVDDDAQLTKQVVK